MNGRAMLVAARSLQNSERCVSTVGSTPCPSTKPLSRFEFIFARPVPVRRLARWTDFRFANGTLSRLPLVGTAITFISFSFERDHAHRVILLDNNILSRYTFLLTNIYLYSN